MRFLTFAVGLLVAVAAGQADAQHRRATTVSEPEAAVPTRRDASPRAWPGARLLIADLRGRIGLVELGTGRVEIIGQAGGGFTDVAFCPSGDLYASTFDGLFAIRKSPFRVITIRRFDQIGLNALTCNADGTLFGYSDHPDRGLFTLDADTGQITPIGGSFGVLSDGDLVFHENRLLLSSTTRDLVTLRRSSGAAVASERHGLDDLFGLVSIGPNELIGCAGTEIYRLNPDTGGKQLLFNYRGNGLGPCAGAAYNGNFRN
jgi:hypothetical protein